ncbi:MAG: nuclear transport factor 2 family protein [Pedosphaera sp.]|nr:nuclear transport factor 2 family protein [Pedosphaera sp.]
MKSFLTAVALLLTLQTIADETLNLAAVRTADKARVAAMQNPNREALNSLFSDELRYAHSNGVVYTKASLIDMLTTSKTKYVGYSYEEQNITFPSPSIALMTGRAHIKAVTATGEMDSLLSFLAVWRQEKSGWRFLAWQSCKLPPAK